MSSQVNPDKHIDESWPVYESRPGQKQPTGTQYTLPSQGTDSYAALTSGQFISPFPQEVSLKKSPVGQRQTPPPHPQRNIVAQSILHNELLPIETREQLVNGLLGTLGQSGRPVTDYTQHGDRYVILHGRSSRESHDHGSDLQSYLNSPYANEELSELFNQMLENKLLQTQEDQEIAKVMIAMSFAAAYPLVALRHLGSLLSSLTTPAAKAMCTASFSSVSSFAAKWAMKVAKDNPEFAATLQKVLGSIGNVSTPAHSHGQEAVGHIHSDGTNHTHTQPHVNEVTTTQEMLVCDRETGEVVDVYYVQYVEYEIDDHAGEHAYVDHQANQAVGEAARQGNSVKTEADRIHEEHQQFIIDEQNRIAERKIVDARLARATDPQEISALQKQRSTTFIANA